MVKDRVGSFTASSFAELMVQRVVSDLAGWRQKGHQQSSCDPLKEFPDSRKRLLAFDNENGLAAAHSEPEEDITGEGSAVPSKDMKRAKKRLRVQQIQHQHNDHLASRTQPSDEAIQVIPLRQAAKEKQRKGQQVNGKKGDVANDGGKVGTLNRLRLPIASSDTNMRMLTCASSSRSSSVQSGSSTVHEVLETATEESPVSPGNTQCTEGHRTPSDGESYAEEAAPRPVSTTSAAASVEAQSADIPPRRRSLRISETTPSNKRVLFNLKKNKVVGAFSSPHSYASAALERRIYPPSFSF